MSSTGVQPRTSKPALGASLVVLSSLFYGSYGVWTKLMGDTFPPFVQGQMRAAVTVVIFLIIGGMRHDLVAINWRKNKRWLLLAIVGNGFISATGYYATLHIGVGLATVLIYAGTMLGMFLLGRIFSGERLNTSKYVSIILGLVGLVVVFRPNLSHLGFVAMALAVFSGLCVALDLVTAQKMHYGALQSNLLGWAAGIPVAFLLAGVSHEHIPAIHADAHWLAFVIFVVVGIASSWLVTAGLKFIEAGAGGIPGLLEIIFGVLFGVVFFHERPGIVTLFGMLTILIAAAIPYMQHFRLKDEPFEL